MNPSNDDPRALKPTPSWAASAVAWLAVVVLFGIALYFGNV